MNREQWIDYHNQKALKRTGKVDSSLHPAINGTATMWVDEKMGACQFVVDGDNLYVTGIVGNFKHWEIKLHEYGVANNITNFVGYTCASNPEAVARVLGMKITNVWFQMERGLARCVSSQQPLPK